MIDFFRRSPGNKTAYTEGLLHHCRLAPVCFIFLCGVIFTPSGMIGRNARWPFKRHHAAADGSTEVDANLVTTLSKDEVVRHISQVFCLERLAASDIPMARSLLSALVQVRIRTGSHCTEFFTRSCVLAQPMARCRLFILVLAPGEDCAQVARSVRKMCMCLPVHRGYKVPVHSTQVKLPHPQAVWDVPGKDRNNLVLLLNHNFATGFGEDV